MRICLGTENRKRIFNLTTDFPHKKKIETQIRTERLSLMEICVLIKQYKLNYLSSVHISLNGASGVRTPPG